jgi:hypothetical protein
MEFAAYVGLDWADQKHAVSLESADGSIVQEFELDQKPDIVHIGSPSSAAGLVDNLSRLQLSRRRGR